MTKHDPNEPVTRALLDDAVHAILEGIEAMFEERDKRFDKIDAGQRELRRQTRDLKHDTPTQKEFDDLKARVEKFQPLS
jgi:hypothetical protein